MAVVEAEVYLHVFSNYEQFTVDGGPLTAAGRFYFLLLQLRLATVLK
jgi:hypothetical protein